MTVEVVQFLHSLVTVPATHLVDYFQLQQRLGIAGKDHKSDQEKLHITVCFFLAHTIPVVVTCILHELAMLMLSSKAVARWRWNGNKKEPFSLKVKAYLVTVFYHVLAAIYWWYHGVELLRKSNPALLETQGTTLTTLLLRDIPLCYVFTDGIFFLIHKGLHDSDWCYKHIHKIHHRFMHTEPIAAEFSHPVEQLGNTIAFVAAPVLFKMSFATWCIWMVSSMFGTLWAHAGWNVGLGVQDSWHTVHHEVFNINYAHTPWMSRWFPFLHEDMRRWDARVSEYNRKNAAAAGGGAKKKVKKVQASVSVERSVSRATE